MSTANIKLYDMFRKNLKLQDGEARELVDAIENAVKEKGTENATIINKDIQSLKEYMGVKFGSLDAKFATKEDLANLRTDLSRTIYFTSLGQLVAIIASVISLILVLKK